MKSSVIPKKSLGQNFLVNPRILDKIVAAAEITEDDIILEVGPGFGNLTAKLAEKAKKVIAIEKDRRLVEELKEKFSAYGGPAAGRKNSNVEIAEGDILKFDHTKYKIQDTRYKVVGNIPYYITSKFLRTVFEKWPKPKLIVLTVQKEVAQRITAKPPKMNLLAVSVQLFSEPKIIGHISKENFRPAPKVDSTIIKLTPKNKLPTDDPEKFFKIVRAGFSQRRKMLIGNLIKNFDILKEDLVKLFKNTGIKQDARAENLSLEQWLKLNEFLKKF